MERLRAITELIDSLMPRLALSLVHGLLPNTGQPWSAGALTASVAPQAGRLVAEAIELLLECKLVRRTGDSYQFESDGQIGHEDSAALLERYAAMSGFDPFFEVLRDWWKGMGAFLSGDRSGPEVLFPRGDLSKWARLHGESHLMSHYASMAADLALARTPGHARLLEIGSGTGACLRALKKHAAPGAIAEYVYTDVSPIFFDFCDPSDAPFALSCELFDIDEAPVSPKVAAGGFDLILSVNTLHVARSLETTAARLASLLNEGGWLILGEGLGGRRWSASLLFAMLPGWWDVEIDALTRPRSGFLGLEEWRQALERSGYLFDADEAARTFCTSWNGGAFAARRAS